MKGDRKIVVDGEEWVYRVGAGSVLARAIGSRRRLLAELPFVTGRSWEEIEHGRLKGTSDGEVTPADVARWIRSECSDVETIDLMQALKASLASRSREEE